MTKTIYEWLLLDSTVPHDYLCIHLQVDYSLLGFFQLAVQLIFKETISNYWYKNNGKSVKILKNLLEKKNENKDNQDCKDKKSVNLTL